MSLSDAAPVCVECGTPVVTPQSGGEEEPLGAAPDNVEPKLYLEKTPRLGGSAIPTRDSAGTPSHAAYHAQILTNRIHVLLRCKNPGRGYIY